jgi:hypothetical protein
MPDQQLQGVLGLVVLEVFGQLKKEMGDGSFSERELLRVLMEDGNVQWLAGKVTEDIKEEINRKRALSAHRRATGSVVDGRPVIPWPFSEGFIGRH